MDIQVQKEIIDKLNNLDEFEKTEVLDFVEFLAFKRQKMVTDFSIIDVLFGKYQAKLSDSDEFARKKQNEIEQEEAKWR